MSRAAMYGAFDDRRSCRVRPIACRATDELPLVRSVAVLGAGTMGAQIAAHFANAGVPSLLLDLTADVARQGLERARTLRPDPFFTADRAALISTGGLRHRLPPDRRRRLDHRGRCRAARRQARTPRARRRGATSRLDRQLQHVGHPHQRARRGTVRRFPTPSASARTSSIHRGICGCWRSYRRRRPTRPWSPPWCTSRITASARARSSRRTRPTSSPTTSRSMASSARSRRCSRGDTRSRRSTRSPGLPSAGRRARRSARATSPASTSSRTWRAPCTTGSRKASARRSGRRRCWRTCSRADGSERRREGASTGARRTRAANPTSSRWIPATMTYRPRQPTRLASIEAARAIEDVRERVRTLFNAGRHGRRVPARNAGADARLHRAGGAAHRQQHRRRGSRNAVGLRLGARARSSCSTRLASARSLNAWRAHVPGGDDVPPLVREVLDDGRNRFRETPVPPAAPGLQILRAAKERSAVDPEERRSQPRGSRGRRRCASSSTRR